MSDNVVEVRKSVHPTLAGDEDIVIVHDGELEEGDVIDIHSFAEDLRAKGYSPEEIAAQCADSLRADGFEISSVRFQLRDEDHCDQHALHINEEEETDDDKAWLAAKRASDRAYAEEREAQRLKAVAEARKSAHPALAGDEEIVIVHNGELEEGDVINIHSFAEDLRVKGHSPEEIAALCADALRADGFDVSSVRLQLRDADHSDQHALHINEDAE